MGNGDETPSLKLGQPIETSTAATDTDELEIINASKKADYLFGEPAAAGTRDSYAPDETVF